MSPHMSLELRIPYPKALESECLTSTPYLRSAVLGLSDEELDPSKPANLLNGPLELHEA